MSEWVGGVEFGGLGAAKCDIPCLIFVCDICGFVMWLYHLLCLLCRDIRASSSASPSTRPPYSPPLSVGSILQRGTSIFILYFLFSIFYSTSTCYFPQSSSYCLYSGRLVGGSILFHLSSSSGSSGSSSSSFLFFILYSLFLDLADSISIFCRFYILFLVSSFLFHSRREGEWGVGSGAVGQWGV